MNTLGIALSFIFVNNLLFTRGLGFPQDKTPLTWKKIGILTGVLTGLIFLGGNLAWLLNTSLLVPSGLTLLQTPAYLVILLILALAYEGLGKDSSPDWPRSQDLILNSALLGALFLLTENPLDYATLAASSVAAALGYGLSLVLLKALDSRLAKEKVPAAFQGLPIRLAACGFAALIFSGADLFLRMPGGQ